MLAHTPAPGVTLQLDSHLAGRSPAHHLTFEVRAGDPEIFRASLIYPDEFQFAGFRTLGPSNTPVGVYQLDFNFDGVADRSLPLLAVTSDLAYVDVLGDGSFSPATDPASHP